MNNTSSAQDLGQRIEKMICEHIAESRACAQQAIARAFAAAGGVSSTPKARVTKSAPGKKRSSEEVAALTERLYEVVCANPGETMTVLCKDVGASAYDLKRSVILLRRAHRVRTVGSRQHTRYYPLASS